MIITRGGSPILWGLIPGFLDENDPRSAREQFHANYFGGWYPFDGFTFDLENGTLHSLLGDPPLELRSVIQFRDELILLFDHMWVLVLQPDNSWEVSKMD
jgi:hypothetical protein